MPPGPLPITRLPPAPRFPLPLRPPSLSMFESVSSCTSTSSLREPRWVKNQTTPAAQKRADDGDAEERLATRAATLLGDHALDGDLLGLDVAVKLGVLGERRELFPILDGPLVGAERVAEDVAFDEGVARDLLEQLDGAERSVIHALFHHHVAGARVGLEARLQRRELARCIGGPRLRPTWLASSAPGEARSSMGRSSGGSIDILTSTSKFES